MLLGLRRGVRVAGQSSIFFDYIYLMRLLSFTHKGSHSWGVLAGDGVIDIGQRWVDDLGQALWRTDAETFAGKCAEIAGQVGSADVAVGDISYLPPVLRPPKIICIGVNYAHRHKEYHDNPDAPRYPSVFMRTPESFTGHSQSLIRPVESVQLDYEGEIVVVIGRQTHRVSTAQAMDSVLGYTLMNEGSVRDWIRHGKFNVTQGKNFPASGSVGPYITTTDELDSGAWQNMSIQTHVNGELRQDDNTSRLMFPFDSIISYLSIFMTLQPGDIIATGTPNGSGARLDPPQYLRPGDVVEISSEQLGTLHNTIADADHAPIEIPTARL